MYKHIGKSVLPLAREEAGKSFTPLGTCFAVGPRKYATAAHVTGPSDQGLAAIIGRADSILDYQDTTNNQIQAIYLKIINYDPIHDICILQAEADVTQLYFGSSPYTLGSSDDLLTGEPALSLGFPHADHGRLVLTQQASLVGARVLLGSSSMKVKHVVLNTQTRPGQSGGPVFTGDGKRIGAMILGGYSPLGSKGSGVSIGGIDPQTLHQTTHAVSAEYILDLI